MKPKNKFQQKVVDLSSKLKPISQKQKDWAFKTLSKKYATVSRNRTFCLECGHKWNEGVKLAYLMENCTCPNCKTKLSYNQDTKINHEATYFAIITTKGGMQVVRMFLYHQYFKKKKESTNHIEEVMQHWIAANGDRETLSKPVNTMSCTYDQWTYGNLEVRSNTDNHYLRYTINPLKIYPSKSILPIIKRNGFIGQFCEYSPQEIFVMLLTDNRAETLYKTEQFSILNVYSSRAGLISRYWKSINICTRHSYKIPDALTWFDYLRFLDYFGKDTSNPKFICPDNLQKAHDELLHKKTLIENEERRIAAIERNKSEALKNKEYQEQYIKMKGKYFGLKFHSGNITINTLSSISDFKKEADQLKHCVFESKYFNKPDSLIMSAKIEGESIETIEISLKDFKIVQSRGLRNQASEHHDHIIDIVRKNINKIVEIKEVERIESVA